jgi:hypothetical protein
MESRITRLLFCAVALGLFPMASDLACAQEITPVTLEPSTQKMWLPAKSIPQGTSVVVASCGALQQVMVNPERTDGEYTEYVDTATGTSIAKIGTGPVPTR